MPMKKIVEYQIVESRSAEELEKTITKEFLPHGFHLYGSLAMGRDKDGDEIYAQPVVRYAEAEESK